MLLKDKNSVITGCNRGIGKEIVRVFAENGSNIWACVRKENTTFTKYINHLEQKHSVRINPVYFDLSDEKQIKAGVQTIKESKKGKETPEWMSTHPSSLRRIQSLKNWIPEIIIEYPPIKKIS